MILKWCWGAVFKNCELSEIYLHYNRLACYCFMEVPENKRLLDQRKRTFLLMASRKQELYVYISSLCQASNPMEQCRGEPSCAHTVGLCRSWGTLSQGSPKLLDAAASKLFQPLHCSKTLSLFKNLHSAQDLGTASSECLCSTNILQKVVWNRTHAEC